MSWNYRVCKETYSKGTQDEEVGFTIREVYYNKNGEIYAMSENSANIYGESLLELGEVMKKMIVSLNKEVIDLDTFIFAKADENTLD